MRLLAHWILSALSLMLVAHFVPGFYVKSFLYALLASVVMMVNVRSQASGAGCHDS